MNNKTLWMATLLTVCLVTATTASLSSSPLSSSRQEKPKGTVNDSSRLVAAGHTLFLTNCAPCHGANAQGDDGPNLHALQLPDAVIAEAIQNGFKNEMPPFGKKLKAGEVKLLTAYVHSLQQTGHPK